MRSSTRVSDRNIISRSKRRAIREPWLLTTTWYKVPSIRLRTLQTETKSSGRIAGRERER